jgi:hypothetical protein
MLSRGKSVSLSIDAAMQQKSVFETHTGALCRFDEYKHHAFGGHLDPIDSPLIVGNVDALRERSTHRHLARNRSSNESGESDEVREKPHFTRRGRSLLKQR